MGEAELHLEQVYNQLGKDGSFVTAHNLLINSCRYTPIGIVIILPLYRLDGGFFLCSAHLHDKPLSYVDRGRCAHVAVLFT